MKYETFVEKFNELSTSEKITIFNNYCLEYGDSDKMIYSFDEEFFNMAFSNPMDAARAVYFGSIESWSDEYICFNAYGNLESLSEYDVDGEIEYYLDEIFDHEKTWEDYIEDDDEEDNENSWHFSDNRFALNGFYIDSEDSTHLTNEDKEKCKEFINSWIEDLGK